MSDLEEISKELQRAIELGDGQAIVHLAQALWQEASRYGLNELGHAIYIAAMQGNPAAVYALLIPLAHEAAAIDVAAHLITGECVSPGTDAALGIVQTTRHMLPGPN